MIRSANNVYGGAVNIAARVRSQAAAGETLVSETVRSLARTSAGTEFADHGLHQLKGITDPHRLYAVVGDQSVTEHLEIRRFRICAGSALNPWRRVLQRLMVQTTPQRL